MAACHPCLSVCLALRLHAFSPRRSVVARSQLLPRILRPSLLSLPPLGRTRSPRSPHFASVLVRTRPAFPGLVFSGHRPDGRRAFPGALLFTGSSRRNCGPVSRLGRLSRGTFSVGFPV